MLSSLKLRKWTQRRGRLKKAFQASEARFSKDPAFGPGKLFYVYQAHCTKNWIYTNLLAANMIQRSAN